MHFKSRPSYIAQASLPVRMREYEVWKTQSDHETHSDDFLRPAPKLHIPSDCHSVDLHTCSEVLNHLEALQVMRILRKNMTKRTGAGF